MVGRHILREQTLHEQLRLLGQLGNLSRHMSMSGCLLTICWTIAIVPERGVLKMMASSSGVVMHDGVVMMELGESWD